MTLDTGFDVRESAHGPEHGRRNISISNNVGGVMTKFVLSIATFALLLNRSAAQFAFPTSAHPQVSVAFFASDDNDKPLSGVTQSQLQILDNKKA